MGLVIIVLAVTKMRNGFCFAGMTEDGMWIRPLPYSKKQWPNLYYDDGSLISVGDVVEVSGDYKPAPPHIEDFETSEFICVDHLQNAQVLGFLRKHCESATALIETIYERRRSLCVVEATSLQVVHTDANDCRKTRVSFIHNGLIITNKTKTPGFPCTDLNWRAFCKHHSVKVLNRRRIYVALGLARAFRGVDGVIVPPAPMVISIIASPPLKGKINPTDP